MQTTHFNLSSFNHPTHPSSKPNQTIQPSKVPNQTKQTNKYYVKDWIWNLSIHHSIMANKFQIEILSMSFNVIEHTIYLCQYVIEHNCAFAHTRTKALSQKALPHSSSGSESSSSQGTKASFVLVAPRRCNNLRL